MIFLILLLSFAPDGAHAQTVEDQVTEQLLAQGYEDITFSRTLLRRLRVVALSETSERELILNPTTGQILRDRSKPLNDDTEATVTISQSPNSTQSNANNDNDNDNTSSVSRPPPPPRDAPPPRPPRPGGN
jgi:hypothetical protein